MNDFDVIVGRQPIFSSALDVVGYELLFRNRPLAVDIDPTRSVGDRMTADVVLSSVDIGIERLVGNKLAFCNASRSVVAGKIPILLSPERTVIEILETVTPTRDVLAGCRDLRAAGYTLALDDITSVADLEPYGGLVQMAKADVRETDHATLGEIASFCSREGIIPIAEKVETKSEMELCLELGYQLFQGYLLARPQHVEGKSLDPAIGSRLRAAGHLLGDEYDLEAVEEFTRSDPALALQLLKLASCGSARGMQRNVQTVRDALVLCGWRRVQSWLMLLLVCGRGYGSVEKLSIALARARTCELAADQIANTRSDVAFLAGMISAFDVLLDTEISTILRQLPLDSSVQAAVAERRGHLGALIEDVVDWQLGRPAFATRSGISDTLLSSAVLHGLLWSIEVSTTLEVLTP